MAWDQWSEDFESSNIKGVGVRAGDLFVEFHSGTTYVYPGLAVEYESLITAESVGKYFREHIRPQSCKQVKITDV